MPLFKISATVRANAKQESLEQIDSTHFRISVKAPAREGKANAAVLRLLARHCNIPQSQLRLVHGFRRKEKIFEVLPAERERA